MAGSANILRLLSEPNRTPRLQDALVHPTRARSSVTGSKDERLQQTAAKPQGGCTRGRPPRGANPVGRPLISTRTRVKSAAAPVRPAVCKGRCRGASSARSSGVRQCRVPDELELRELVGLTVFFIRHAACMGVSERIKSRYPWLRPRKKAPLPSWLGNSQSWGGGRR